MPIAILYFAAAREAAGTGREELPAGAASVAALRAELIARHPALAALLPRCRLAVGEALAEDGDPVPDGAEVAVLPPVSGGAPGCRLTDAPLDPAVAAAAVRAPGRGAVVTFAGDVRDLTGSRRVVRLEYEAYRAMASRVLEAIAAEVGAAHGAALCIHHRVGHLTPGQTAVVVAAAAPHRAAAFRACQEAVDRLKREAPIWKREVFEDGSAWVGLGP